MTSPVGDDELHITSLLPEDGGVVRRWLADFLRHHNRHWAAVRGLGWSDGEVDAQLLASDLVADHWDRLIRSARRSDSAVFVARLGQRPVGSVWVAVRTDDYLGVPAGLINWVYVDRWARGHGVGMALMGAGLVWLRTSGVRSVAVSVLANNEQAIRLYRRAGLVVADVRLMGTLESVDTPSD